MNGTTTTAYEINDLEALLARPAARHRNVYTHRRTHTYIRALVITIAAVTAVAVAALLLVPASQPAAAGPARLYDWHGRMPTGITLSGLQAYLFSETNVTMMDRQAQAAASIWKGSTDRIQIIQDKLVGADGRTVNRPYLRYVRQVVSGALHAGLTVVLNAQTEESTGYPLSEPLPTVATWAFWRVMMRHYANNPRIDFDLFNEPRHCDWAQWYAAFQPLVTMIRKAGAHNQLWIGGRKWDSTLAGMPPLHDPDHDLVYTVHHPGSDAGGTVEAPTDAQLDAAFGYLASEGYRVVDAEFANFKGSYDWFRPGPNVRRYLRYLTAHHIGLLAWSLLPGALNANADYASVTSEPEGAGSLIRHWFARVARERK